MEQERRMRCHIGLKWLRKLAEWRIFTATLIIAVNMSLCVSADPFILLWLFLNGVGIKCNSLHIHTSVCVCVYMCTYTYVCVCTRINSQLLPLPVITFSYVTYLIFQRPKVRGFWTRGLGSLKQFTILCNFEIFTTYICTCIHVCIYTLFY